MSTGILYAALAFLSWGLFPLYFHQLKEVTPAEILVHRVVWSLLFLVIVLAIRRQWKWLRELLQKPRVIGMFLGSSILLSLNWLIYIWAVNNGHVIEASLGYFINPLVNIMFGYVLLKERLRRMQWAAIALAALGVAWLTWQAGRMPWIALALALSFGGYGLMRKTAALGALEGLSIETMLLFPFGIAYMAWLYSHGQLQLLQTESATVMSMLVLLGPTTAIPLLLFAAGARRIPLSVLGLLQYISPTMQFLLGVAVFHEAFTSDKLVGFALIWSALALYAAEGLYRHRQASNDSTA